MFLKDTTMYTLLMTLTFCLSVGFVKPLTQMAGIVAVDSYMQTLCQQCTDEICGEGEEECGDDDFECLDNGYVIKSTVKPRLYGKDCLTPKGPQTNISHTHVVITTTKKPHSGNGARQPTTPPPKSGNISVKNTDNLTTTSSPGNGKPIITQSTSGKANNNPAPANSAAYKRDASTTVISLAGALLFSTCMIG